MNPTDFNCSTFKELMDKGENFYKSSSRPAVDYFAFSLNINRLQVLYNNLCDVFNVPVNVRPNLLSEKAKEIDQ